MIAKIILVFFLVHERECHSKIAFNVTKEHPFIFIGGYPRSGTSVMRAIVESHPDVRCGDETTILIHFLQWWRNWEMHGYGSKYLIYYTHAEELAANYIMDVITSNGPPAKRFCNKDPSAFHNLDILSR